MVLVNWAGDLSLEIRILRLPCIVQRQYLTSVDLDPSHEDNKFVFSCLVI